jgi:hypothetical protein
MAVSEDQCGFFKEHEYFILCDTLSQAEVSEIQSWSQEVHDCPREQDS